MFHLTRRLAGIVFACAPLCASTFAQSGTDAPLNAFLTRSAFDPEVTLWARGDTYAAHNLGLVHPGQTVELNLFLKHFGISHEGQSHVTYDIVLSGPDGSQLQRGDDLTALHQPMNATRTYMTANEVAILRFEPEYAPGTYRIHATVTDHVRDEAVTVGAYVELQALQAVASFETASEFEYWLTHYYLDPTPGRALKGFLESAEPMADAAVRSWAQVIFFREVFAQNQWLHAHLVAALSEGTPTQRKNIAFMLGLLQHRDPELFEGFSGAEASLYHEARNLRLPDSTDAIHSPEALEMHWFRFFASGDILSLQPIVQLLEYADYEGTLRSLADVADSLDDTQRQAALKDVLFQSARWSLAGNCIEHPAVHRFCTYLAQTGQLSAEAELVLVDLLQAVRQQLAAGNPPVSASEG